MISATTGEAKMGLDAVLQYISAEETIALTHDGRSAARRATDTPFIIPAQ